MTLEKFLELINSSESKTLDFKSEFYDFETDSDVKRRITFQNSSKTFCQFIIPSEREMAT